MDTRAFLIMTAVSLGHSSFSHYDCCVPWALILSSLWLLCPLGIHAFIIMTIVSIGHSFFPIYDCCVLKASTKKSPGNEELNLMLSCCICFYQNIFSNDIWKIQKFILPNLLITVSVATSIPLSLFLFTCWHLQKDVSVVLPQSATGDGFCTWRCLPTCIHGWRTHL